MPLPDILQFLGLGRKTGVLCVEAHGARKAVAFEDGVVVFCTSGNAKEYLGQHLLARTRLTTEQLASAFEAQERDQRRLGEILVGEGLVTEAELATVLGRKVEDSLYELFTWPSGQFTFEEHALAAGDAPVRIALNWQDAVMEGCRRADETARLREVIPGPAMRFHAVPSRYPKGFPRTSGDRKLIELVEQGLSVGQICPRFHASDFDILSRVRTLVLEGILAPDEKSRAEALVPDHTRELRRAQELIRDGELCEALQALRAAALRYPGDAEIAAELERLDVEVRESFATLGGLDAVPRLEGGLERLTRLQLTAQQGFVASRVSGSWSVRTLVQLCPFEEVDVLATLVELARRGVLDFARVPAGAGR